MGLRGALARLSARHAHVLVVENPGGWRTRFVLERAILDRGWRLALSPADADVLAVCGESFHGLDDTVEQVWEQMPGPRVRIDAISPEVVQALLDDAHDRLLDNESHRRDARDRVVAADLLDGGDTDDDGMDMDHGDMDMDHGDMDMDMAPSGIALAEGGEDRDGLEMDLLHLPLGPVLPYWPAGLVVHCTLQGDLIVDARAESIGSQTPMSHTPMSERDAGVHHVARSIDNLVSLLGLAGWEDAASQARDIRDELQRGSSTETMQRFALLQRRIRGSRILRLALGGVRPVESGEDGLHDFPVRLTGDTHDRLLAMLDGISGHLDGTTEPAGGAPSAAEVARCMIGLDLATARLVVASLDLHAVMTGAGHEESHAR